MSEGQKRFTWATKFYDRILVVAVLLLLAGSSAYLATRLKLDFAALRLETGVDTHGSPNNVTLLNTEELDKKQAMRLNPFQTGTLTDRMLISELRVRCASEACQLPISYDARTCPFCGVAQPEDGKQMLDSDGDFIPDELEKQYDLDPFDPNDVKEDHDNDGFTTLEEFDLTNLQWLSNPRDTKSYPPPYTKLRLVRVKATPFKIQFKGVQALPDGARYQLNLAGNSRFAKMDEVITVNTQAGGKEDYQVVDYREVVRVDQGRKTDESVLVLECNGSKVNLVKNMPVTREDKEAWMLFLIDNQALKHRINEVFELKGYTYKVIDIDGDGVLLEDVRLGDKVIRIPRISDEEINAIKRARSEEP